MLLKNYYRIILILLFFFSIHFSIAQTPAAYNSADIYLQLKKLNVLGSVLYFAAHPDDENTRLLTYFSKEKLYRTGYISLTRGDGGQNLIGDEQGIDLGLLRTQELLSARRMDGAEQFFSSAYDFGYSKSADEALRIWDHNKILSDAVWVIRRFQPDIIITRFPPDERAGHGHHAASAILAKEAFIAAADTTKFPEQFQYGVKPWQAKRILWNTYNFGGNNTTSPDQFKIDIGEYNPLLGKSYGEIASESRSQHKSQGFGVSRQRGQSFEYFQLTAGEAVKNDLLDDVNTTWQRLKGGDAIQKQINIVTNEFKFEHPENSVDGLGKLYQSIQELPDSYWKNKKLDEVKQLIVACSGIYAEATTANEFAVSQQKFVVQFLIDKRSESNIQLKKIQLLSFDSSIDASMPTDENITFSKSFSVSDIAVIQPYWLQNPLNNKGSFIINDQRLIGTPQNDATLNAAFIFTVYGTDITVQRPVQYKFTDPVKGELYEPFIISNPLNISLQPSVILTNIRQEKVSKNDNAQVAVRSNIDALNVSFKLLFVQDKDSSVIKDTTINLETNRVYYFDFSLSKLYNNNSGDPNVAVQIKTNHFANTFSGNLHSIQYDHIPYIHYYATDKIHIINEEVKTVGKHIGYVVGAGDKVPQTLLQLGYDVTFLNEKDITAYNLKQFDAVITGVRAYNIHEWLYEKYNVLMNYISNGGNFIVQYSTNNQVGSVSTNIGPYNFNIGRTRVTEENADVHILLPENTALNYPNKITATDFKGWVQERSTYQAEQLDAHYEALFGMHDVNEPESNGSLIIGKYGKGNFVYTGLVFFRELPAGVAGAYRLMANLIALPQNK